MSPILESLLVILIAVVEIAEGVPGNCAELITGHWLNQHVGQTGLIPGKGMGKTNEEKELLGKMKQIAGDGKDRFFEEAWYDQPASKGQCCFINRDDIKAATCGDDSHCAEEGTVNVLSVQYIYGKCVETKAAAHESDRSSHFSNTIYQVNQVGAGGLRRRKGAGNH